MSELNTGDKKIWRRHELNISDWLDTFKEDLIKEFLTYHDDFIDGDFKKSTVVNNPYNPEVVMSHPKAWKSTPIRYYNPFGKPTEQLLTPNLTEEIKHAFPTAIKMTDALGDDCGISVYSVIEANSVISRHTGPENRNADYIRIHVPLIVPEGDIFFEVAGEEIDWSDTFGFDNQRTHSAHNYSNKRRLVYLIDIHRRKLGIPPGVIHTLEREQIEAAIPFVRGSKG
jgi:hypothetical protein